MGIRWQDKLTGSSVFRWRLNAEWLNRSFLMWRGTVFQILGADMWKTHEPNGTKSSWEEDEHVDFGVVWSKAVRGMAGDRYVVLYKWVWRVWTWFSTLSGASGAVPWVGLIGYENAVAKDYRDWESVNCLWKPFDLLQQTVCSLEHLL